MASRSAATSKAAPPAPRRARGSCSRPTARSRSMSAPPRSGRVSRRCSRRSPPTRSNCRWTRIDGVFHGSTDHVREGYGSYSSRSVVMGGNAIVAAAASCGTQFARPPRKSWAARRTRSRSIDGTGARGPGANRCRSRASPGSRPNRPTPATSAPTAMARMPPMSRSIRKTGQVELIDYVAVEDVGPHHQSIDTARADRRRHRAGPGRRAAGALRLRRERTTADRLARRLPDADRGRLSRASGRSRWRTSPRPTIRSAPRAPARAASFRSAASSPMRWRRRWAPSASSRASCRSRRRGCGSSSTNK